jgi:hypothetical protein
MRNRFDPAICGKAVRIVAAVCVVEFLATIALLVMWVPADSPCRAWSAPIEAPTPIYPVIPPVALATLWTCVLAIFWKHFARLVVAQLQQEERQRAPALHRLLQRSAVNHTALLTIIFLSFAGFVAIPLVIILRNCGP